MSIITNANSSVKVSPEVFKTDSHVSKESLSDVARRIHSLSGKEEETGVEKKIKAAHMLAKDKPASVRIAEHNKKAQEALSKDEDISDYPFIPDEKEIARETWTAKLKQHRETLIKKGKKQKSGSDKITSVNGHAKSGIAYHVAYTQGLREYMEDAYLLPTSFKFKANGKEIPADIFGVFDGHGGSKTVEYIRDHLVDRLKEELKKGHGKKDPNDDDIFQALKNTVSRLHEECVKKFEDGSTAVFGFKLQGSDELWTANIGDSFAYLNRNGKTIPMSIEQKPFFSYQNQENRLDKKEFIESNANEYARQLMCKGVELSIKDEKKEREFDREIEFAYALNRPIEKMVMSYQYTNIDEKLHAMMLGVKKIFHFDMARSIGDSRLDRYKKFTPEIFKQTVQKGDHLILQTDGVAFSPKAIVEIFQQDTSSGFSIAETLESVVGASIAKGDNICAMIVSF